jgi:hypothetical protein
VLRYKENLAEQGVFMPSLTTRNRRKIREAVDFLNRNRRPITVELEGDERPFISKIIKAEHGGETFPRPGGIDRYLLLEMLSPQNGNELIQSSRAVRLRFCLGKSDCEFPSRYIKKSVVSPYYGHIVTYPECIILMDRRRHNRYEIDTSKAPLFVSARLTVRAGHLQEENYDFRVFDISEKGVGVLVGEEMQDSLKDIDFGCRLEEIELLAPWATIKLAGTVKHKSRIHEGKYGGCCVLGIQLDENLERYV